MSYTPTFEVVAGILALVVGVLLVMLRADLADRERKWPRVLRIWRTTAGLRRWHVFQGAVAIAYGVASVADGLMRFGRR